MSPLESPLITIILMQCGMFYHHVVYLLHLNEPHRKKSNDDAEKCSKTVYSFSDVKKFQILQKSFVHPQRFIFLQVRGVYSTMPLPALQRMTYRKERILPCSEIIIKHPSNKNPFFVCQRMNLHEADKSRNIGIFVMLFGCTMALLCLPGCLLFA